MLYYEIRMNSIGIISVLCVSYVNFQLINILMNKTIEDIILLLMYFNLNEA